MLSWRLPINLIIIKNMEITEYLRNFIKTGYVPCTLLWKAIHTWHSGIAGPWAWILDPENAGLWTDIAIQKHKKISHFGLVCFWADISGNIGPKSSISGSKVQAQGTAIPECLDTLGKDNVSYRAGIIKHRPIAEAHGPVAWASNCMTGH